MRVGFLLLGITGGAAGAIIGLGLARAVGRSIVQLDVSVRGVAGKLTEVSRPVRISHSSHVEGLQAGIAHLESEITQVVELIQHKETELLRSEQLAIVGQLAAGMAHELRNPLMPIKVLVQSTLARPGDACLNRRQLQIVDDELNRLEESIQSFLDFARPPELVMTRLDAKSVVYQVVDLVYPKAHQHEVELHCVVPEVSLEMLGDRTQLKQLLLNLLLNALDARPEGGLIHIVLEDLGTPISGAKSPSLDSEQDALRLARDSEEAESPRLAIRIFDDGPGLPPELLPRIFEPFVTSKDTGTGLGLTICRQIVEAHQGKITASNPPRGGAEFCITLPYLAERRPAELALETAAS
ncbi:MAG: ATP-binding protein [Pirellulales bacterium]